MNVLYISSKPAYPIVDGGAFATAAFLKTLLFQEIAVDYLFISTPKHPFKKEHFPKDFFQKLNVAQQEIDTSINIFDAFKYLFNSKSYNVARFYSKKMSELIIGRLREKTYDVIVLDSLFTTCYVEDIKSVSSCPIFVRTHNVEGDIWDGYAKNAKGLKAIYLNKLAKDIRKYEIEILNRVDGILAITHEDLARFDSLGIQPKKKVIPVAIDCKKNKANYKNNEVYHLGAMNWYPNRESVDKLIEIWPQVRNKINEAKLTIAGKETCDFYTSQPKLGIDVIGFVDDPTSFAYEKGILAAPIISGSGIRIKILEAMAAGIPVVSTKIGAQGINDNNSTNLLVAETDEELINSIIELINSKEKREEIGQNAFNYICKNHNIAQISQNLIEFFKSKK